MDNDSTPKVLIYGLILLMLLVFIAAFAIDKANKSREELPVLGKVTDFGFKTSTGDSLHSLQITGRLYLLDFIFTNCKNACPVMSSKMSELYKYYEHTDKVGFISITVDPVRDTPQVLQDYAKSHGVTDNRWTFLRGPIDEVIRVSEKVFMLPADNLPMGHSTKFVLIDENGNIRAYYDAMTDGILPLVKTQVNALGRKLP